MNFLLVPSPGIWPVLEFEIDLLQSALDDGYNVTYVFCKGSFKSCIANKENPRDLFNPFICIRCKNKSLNALRLLSDQSKVNIIEYNGDIDELNERVLLLKEEFNTDFLDVENLKKIVDIDGCDIYDSALSTLMTTLKDSHPSLSMHKKLFLGYLLEGLCSYDFYKKLFEKSHFEKIVVFNGRVSRYRPVLRLCKMFNLNFEVLEYPEYTFDRYILTPNQYPHDFAYRSQILRRFVDESPLEQEEKIKLGKELIEDSINHKEIHGIGIGNFVSHQKINHLPPRWDSTHFNIVIFTSSDFENAAIPEYYDKLYGGSQYATIKGLRELLPDDIKITVRIHPNQIDKDRTAAKILENLNSRNITIVKPADLVDSYNLAMCSNLVITFGSQLSVESAYMGKQVIVFGNSNYEAFNFSVNIGKDILLASSMIKDYFYNNKLLLENLEDIKNEACLHMFARKYQGVVPKYLIKNSYIGGELFIDGIYKQIKIDKFIYSYTKYLGGALVIYNIFLSKGYKQLLLTIKILLTKSLKL